jgi:hypothetical protein
MMKLEKLAEALKQRPSLQLEVKGTIDKKHDRLALAEADLMNQIKKDKQWEMRVAGKRVSGKAEDISLSDKDYRRLITKAYEDKFGEDPENLFAGEVSASTIAGASSEGVAEPAGAQFSDRDAITAAAKQRLIENIEVEESRLQQLAKERAQHIQGHLIETGAVPKERISITGIEEIAGASAGKTVRTNLTLSATE